MEPSTDQQLPPVVVVPSPAGPTEKDVRLEQGKSFEFTAGNSEYRASIDGRKDRYRHNMKCQNRQGKKEIVDEVILALELKGSRVFHRGIGEDAWVQDANLGTTVADALRAATRTKKSRKSTKSTKRLSIPCQRCIQMQAQEDDLAKLFEATSDEMLQEVLPGDLPDSNPSGIMVHDATHSRASESITAPLQLPEHLSAIADAYFESNLKTIQQKLLMNQRGRKAKRMRVCVH